MVHFGGRPSRGCQTCRNRKIKCDLKPGGCSYCQKTGNLCPGFRAEVDIMFRDESQHVADKVRKKASIELKQKKKIHQKTESIPSATYTARACFDMQSWYSEIPVLDPCNISCDTSFLSLFLSPITSPYLSLTRYQNTYTFARRILEDSPSPTPSLELSLEDQALAFFITYNVLPGPTIPVLDVTALSSCKAVGFAGLSNFKKTLRIQLESRRSYAKAIEHVNNALSDPVTAQNDSTLFAIIMLGQAEQIDGMQKSFVEWDQHIRGAGALLALRGTRSLQTATQIRLFHQAISALILSCLRMRIAFPEGVVELLELATRNSNRTEPTYRALMLTVKVTTWLANIRGGLIVDRRVIVDSAQELEAEALEVFTATRNTSEWAYESVYKAASNNMDTLDHYHLYKSWISAQTWIGVRACRMLLHGLMIEALSTDTREESLAFSTDEFVSQTYISKVLISQLRIDILASVAQQLNSNPILDATPLNLSLSIPYIEHVETPKFLWSNFADPVSNFYNIGVPSDGLPFIRSSGGVLPWVLYLVGLSPGVSNSQMQNSLLALKYIGNNLGMRQASYLASDLEALTNPR